MKPEVLLDSRYHRALEIAIGQHLVAFVATAFMLDGGEMLRMTLVAMAAYWTFILVILLRRPLSPTKIDLLVIRWGFVPVGAIALAAAFAIGWTLARAS